MIRCGACGESKPEDDFTRCSSRKTGRQFWCKVCERAKKLARYHAVYSNNDTYRQKKKEYDRKRRQEKLDELRAYDRARKSLPHRRAASAELTRRRRGSFTKATPSWLSADQKRQIKQVYEMAQIMRARLKVDFQVDHIVPLLGENVCGLHVPWNLQLLEAGMNAVKSNEIICDLINNMGRIKK